MGASVESQTCWIGGNQGSGFFVGGFGFVVVEFRTREVGRNQGYGFVDGGLGFSVPLFDRGLEVETWFFLAAGNASDIPSCLESNGYPL